MRSVFELASVVSSSVASAVPSGACRAVSRRTLSAVLTTALVGGLALTASVAAAEEPVGSVDEVAPSATVTQSTTTTVVTAAPAPAASVVLAPVAPAAPVAPVAPAAPYSAGSFQGPVYFNGPVWIIPAQPGVAQPVMPQQLPPPPVFVQPAAPRVMVAPPLYRAVPKRYSAPLRIQPKVERGPSVGVGLRFSALGLSTQEVFGEKMKMMGGGLQVRFRNQGHWGFELGLDALRSNINDGAFVRSSYPFTFGPMLYAFKNRPENHFNIYAVAGFGLMSDDVTLYKDSAQERKQRFWEVMANVGGGIELRFRHLALFTDVRAIGLLLDDASEAGAFYQDVQGGPIPPSSAGYKANVGALLWF